MRVKFINVILVKVPAKTSTFLGVSPALQFAVVVVRNSYRGNLGQ